MGDLDFVWIESVRRQEQFLAEATRNRQADLAAQSRRKPEAGPFHGRRMLVGGLAATSIAWLPLVIRSVRRFGD